jgi:tRNA(Ile)-lysidine synthase
MMLNKIKDTIRKFALIDKGDRVLIGVSAGPDSIALFYLLHALSSEFKLNLHIAHLDHMLRKDSYKDRVFVEKLAERFGVPIIVKQVRVKELIKAGSVEEVARNVRLEFLFKAAEEIKADKIALGHNSDDQAETVLMRILRGAGLYGLAGILPKREIYGHMIIRPLIEIRRKDIETYLRKKKIRSRIDASNLEDIYFRNRIRNRLLPLLEKEYNKNIKTVLSNTAESVGLDYDYLINRARQAMKRSGTKIVLNKLLKLHPAIQRLALRLTISKVKGDMRRITFQHIRELEDLILNRPVNSIVDLPKGISVIKKEKYLVFLNRKP